MSSSGKEAIKHARKLAFDQPLAAEAVQESLTPCMVHPFSDVTNSQIWWHTLKKESASCALNLLFPMQATRVGTPS